MNKINNIKNYVKRLATNTKNPALLYDEYKDDLKTVTPEEAFEIFTELKEESFNELEILVFLDKVVHVFYDNLRKVQPNLNAGHKFLDELLYENRLLEAEFDKLRPLMKKIGIPNIRHEMIEILNHLKLFYVHYEKKENLLFPLLESKDKKYDGLTIMWALHNEVKIGIDQCIFTLKQESSTTMDVVEVVSQLFFDMLGLIQKEEFILYPAAINLLTKKEWNVLAYQAQEYDGAFNSKKSKLIEDESLAFTFDDLTITTSTGSLRIDEVLMIFNTLELDMTYVDENDKVRYFTRPKDRIFPRSVAVIGRDVSNCHPPQSVHIVEEIVEHFRNGTQDKAQFWIDMRGKKILIQYFALRDKDKKYRGVLEVSSDITEIQKLEGQQRLAQYHKSK